MLASKADKAATQTPVRMAILPLSQHEAQALTNSTDIKHTAAGLAALSICESLLLALGDLGILGKKDLIGILEDAAAAHRGVGADGRETAVHLEAGAILERIEAGRNSLPLP
jgi:hypothetical protein